MISQREIERLSQELCVSKNTIDKNWVLGHFIDAIYSVNELKKMLIFKGGTCLKKCYFPDYRFSEDLDFTSSDENFIFTEKHLKNILKFVFNQSDIVCHIVSLRDLVFKDKKTGYEAVVKYWGADHAKNIEPPTHERWQTSIKIEIINYELMLFPPVKKKIIHQFSDKLSANSNNITCYSIEEIMSEKIRALMQRKYTAPRDYYDIWYLNRNYKKIDHKKVVEAFHKKVKYKNLNFTGIEQLINPKHERILALNWKNSLSYQIGKMKLIDYKVVISELQEYFIKNFK